MLHEGAKTIPWEKMLFSINGVGQTGPPSCRRTRLHLTPNIQVNSKQDKDLELKLQNPWKKTQGQSALMGSLVNTCVLWADTAEQEGGPEDEREYLQILCLRRGRKPACMSSDYNSTAATRFLKLWLKGSMLVSGQSRCLRHWRPIQLLLL